MNSGLSGFGGEGAKPGLLGTGGGRAEGRVEGGDITITGSSSRHTFDIDIVGGEKGGMGMSGATKSKVKNEKGEPNCPQNGNNKYERECSSVLETYP